jgi:hypothetical protein
MTAPRLLVATALAAALLPRLAGASASTAEPAALLVFPLIVVDAGGQDSLIQLTNTADAPVAVRCLYENVGGTPALRPFAIRLLADQPVAWGARHGLAVVPGDGGSIPALDPGPFTGVLRCLAVDSDGTPTDRNVLVGSVDVLTASGSPVSALDSLRYNATGLDAVPGAPNADDQLMLGGSAAEYAACPASVVLQSFLDGAILDLGADAAVQRELSTELVLVTCAHDPIEGADATVDFALTNEFGQQFHAARALREQLVVLLSNIDTANPSRSIFNVATQGSLTGSIRITPRAGGSAVLALAVQTQADPNDASARHAAAIGTQLDGERTAPDVVDLTAPMCVGDCNGDGTVAINELITGVNIALGNQLLSTCPAFDADGDGSVAINELITAVNNALGACS